MKIAHECLASVKEDIKPLIEKHWELVALNQGKIKLNPNWEEYARLDAAGILRDDEDVTDQSLYQYAFYGAAGLRIAGGTDEILKLYESLDRVLSLYIIVGFVLQIFSSNSFSSIYKYFGSKKSSSFSFI